MSYCIPLIHCWFWDVTDIMEAQENSSTSALNAHWFNFGEFILRMFVS
jgi:hypothetical protein